MSILDGIAQMVSGSSPDMDQLERERQRERWFRSLQRTTTSAAAPSRFNSAQWEAWDKANIEPHSPPDIDPLGR